MEKKVLNGKMAKIRLIRKILIHKRLTEIGLYYGQPPILDYVNEHSECTQVEIADKFGISPASVAKSTKRMVNNGLLTKTADANNLRCNKLVITEKGRELHQKCVHIFDDIDNMLFAGFSEADFEQLGAYYDLMLDNISGDEFRNIDIDVLCSMVTKQKGEKK